MGLLIALLVWLWFWGGVALVDRMPIANGSKIIGIIIWPVIFPYFYSKHGGKQCRLT